MHYKYCPECGQMLHEKRLEMMGWFPFVSVVVNTGSTALTVACLQNVNSLCMVFCLCSENEADSFG